MSAWQQQSERFSQLKPREKNLVFFGSLALLIYLSVIYLLEPAYKQLQLSQAQQLRSAKQLQDATQQAELFRQQLAIDANQHYREQIQVLEQQQQQLNAEIRQSASHFIGAEQMVALLRNVLQSSQAVQVKSLQTAMAEPVRLPGQQAEDPALLFQHKTTLVLSGSYADLFQVLQRMEQLPWLLNWAELRYKVVTYPTAELALTLITVSEYEDFIRL
uniref:MSHA biogenesis protein MshJ n=1 Tax=Rheinheimera sp. BAL341 TaxID=1708203 RepID=A0A486XHI5_9GAMM